ncbi:AI-2E family transporter [Methanosarcina sp. KYL-1]|uniref:AI-2E family transporter n=1 Tax=Methanosarcina sp. KYL-1 TaxID=2602068 RepID=UPI0021007B42|nr:AI-2E family transporter [Methanosarcina sp. KYL-1]MCQ1535644.1 AI-2E family transporter [Methanosarcina sp. KYL-1]
MGGLAGNRRPGNFRSYPGRRNITDKQLRSDFARSAPYWLRRAGVVSWLFLGIVLAASTVLSVIATVSSITVPLLVAVVIGIVFRPLVDMLERRRVPRSVGTVLTMLFIFLGAAALFMILVKGFIDQGAEIVFQLKAGWESLEAWLLQFQIKEETLNSISSAVSNALPALGQGIIGLLSSTFTSAAALLIGVYFSVFILFFILRDGPEMEAWLARQFKLKPGTGTAIVADISRSIRLYFRGTALTAAITAIVVAIPLIILKVPLVGSILILYFFTSFIPYIGAFIGGAFAVIIAFGSGGAETALIIAVAVTISNGALQNAINTWALGTTLKVHPLLVFLVTIAAGVVGGALAMILAVPLTAVVIQTVHRLREEGVFAED